MNRREAARSVIEMGSKIVSAVVLEERILSNYVYRIFIVQDFLSVFSLCHPAIRYPFSYILASLPCLFNIYISCSELISAYLYKYPSPTFPVKNLGIFHILDFTVRLLTKTIQTQTF